jgi:hypothetical protein
MLIANWLQAALLLAIFIASITGAALYLHKILSKNEDFFATVLPITLGTYLSVVVLTGIATLYSGWFQALLLVPGLAFLFIEQRRLSSGFTFKLPHFNTSYLWLVFPILYFVVRVLSAGLPQQHSDGLYYHIVAAKHWALWKQIQIEPTHPSWAQSTLIESAYGLPFLWLKAAGIETNVSAQIFSQWFQMVFGQILCVVLGVRILKTYLDPLENNNPLESSPALYFISWLCICIPCLEWTGALSKTDYTLLMFIMAGFLAAKKQSPILAGILMGFAFQTKIFALWAIVGLVVFIPPRKWLVYGTSTALASLPVLIKNYLFTKNPLFPALDHVIGPHWISSAWNQANATFVGLPRFDSQMFRWYWDVALEGKTPKLFIVLGFIASIVVLIHTLNQQSYIANNSLTKLNLFAKDLVLFNIQAMGCMAVLRPVANGRYSASATALLFFALWARIIYVSRSPVFIRRPYLAYTLLALGLLVNIPVELIYKVPAQYLFASREKYIEQFHPNYQTIKWLNENTSSDAHIYFNTDKVNFYLDRNYETITEMAKWENILSPLTNLNEVLQRLKSQGFTHAQFHFESRGYAKLEPYPQVLIDSEIRPVFQTKNEYVYDLSKL